MSRVRARKIRGIIIRILILIILVVVLTKTAKHIYNKRHPEIKTESNVEDVRIETGDMEQGDLGNSLEENTIASLSGIGDGGDSEISAEIPYIDKEILEHRSDILLYIMNKIVDDDMRDFKILVDDKSSVSHLNIASKHILKSVVTYSPENVHAYTIALLQVKESSEELVLNLINTYKRDAIAATEKFLPTQYNIAMKSQILVIKYPGNEDRGVSSKCYICYVMSSNSDKQATIVRDYLSNIDDKFIIKDELTQEELDELNEKLRVIVEYESMKDVE